MIRTRFAVHIPLVFYGSYKKGVPINGTPFGEIIEPNRFITVTGIRNEGDSILMDLNFKAVLGNSDYTNVRLESFNWIECESDIIKKDSAVKIIDLCQSGGTRLFFSDYIKLNYFHLLK